MPKNYLLKNFALMEKNPQERNPTTIFIFLKMNMDSEAFKLFS